jgi:toxin HigB-1
MDIIFEDRKLEKIVNNEQKCIKKFGPICSKILLKRLQRIREAEHFDELKHLPGRFHQLTADRPGQFAFDLEHPLKLIIKPQIEAENLDPIGNFIAALTTVVIVIEIEDYH